MQRYQIFDRYNVKFSAVFSGGAGGARAPPEFGGSQKGQSLISAYQSLAITTNTPGFEKLNTALLLSLCRTFSVILQVCFDHDNPSAI